MYPKLSCRPSPPAPRVAFQGMSHFLQQHSSLRHCPETLSPAPSRFVASCQREVTKRHHALKFSCTPHESTSIPRRDESIITTKVLSFLTDASGKVSSGGDAGACGKAVALPKRVTVTRVLVVRLMSGQTRGGDAGAYGKVFVLANPPLAKEAQSVLLLNRCPPPRNSKCVFSSGDVFIHMLWREGRAGREGIDGFEAFGSPQPAPPIRNRVEKAGPNLAGFSGKCFYNWGHV